MLRRSSRAGLRPGGNRDDLHPILLPRRSIETSADADDLRRLWTRVRRAWESLGDERPFHSVLTDDRYLPSRMSEWEAQFWHSGEVEAEQLADYLADLGLVKLADATLLEFGCGVGRVTIPLAAIAKSVIAYDISDRHLRFARERAAALGRTNIRAIAIGDSLPAQFEPCDVFYSRIVLQHNPPPIIGDILRKLIRSLARGGVGVFQVPTHYVGYVFSTRGSSPLAAEIRHGHALLSASGAVLAHCGGRSSAHPGARGRCARTPRPVHLEHLRDNQNEIIFVAQPLH